MKAFLIQSVFNQVVHDFSFHLIEAINYNNWYYSKPVYTYALSETTDHPSFWGKVMSLELDNIIPIGTVEFVLEYLAKCPCCGEELSESLGDGYYKHWTTKKICDCGQKLRWD